MSASSSSRVAGEPFAGPHYRHDADDEQMRAQVATGLSLILTREFVCLLGSQCHIPINAITTGQKG
jgi:hypothetical protein